MHLLVFVVTTHSKVIIQHYFNLLLCYTYYSSLFIYQGHHQSIHLLFYNRLGLSSICPFAIQPHLIYHSSSSLCDRFVATHPPLPFLFLFEFALSFIPLASKLFLFRSYFFILFFRIHNIHFFISCYNCCTSFDRYRIHKY